MLTPYDNDPKQGADGGSLLDQIQGIGLKDPAAVAAQLEAEEYECIEDIADILQENLIEALEKCGLRGRSVQALCKLVHSSRSGTSPPRKYHPVQNVTKQRNSISAEVEENPISSEALGGQHLLSVRAFQKEAAALGFKMEGLGERITKTAGADVSLLLETIRRSNQLLLEKVDALQTGQERILEKIEFIETSLPLPEGDRAPESSAPKNVEGCVDEASSRTMCELLGGSPKAMSHAVMFSAEYEVEGGRSCPEGDRSWPLPEVDAAKKDGGEVSKNENQSSTDLITRANEALQANDFDAVFALSTQALDRSEVGRLDSKVRAEALYLKALSSERTNVAGVDELIRLYQEVESFDSCHAPALTNLGRLLYSRGEIMGAEAAFRKAVDSNPDYSSAWNSLGLMLFKERGNNSGAEEAYRCALKVESSFAEAHFNLGVLLEKKGDVEGAEEAYRCASELDPKLADAFYNLGNLLEELGDVEGAEAAYLKADEAHEE